MITKPIRLAASSPDRKSWLNPGYQVAFRMGAVNSCPACGRRHWYIGAVMAECAFCECALPIVHQRIYEPVN